MSNVEIKKEIMLHEEKYSDLEKRMKNNENKYENMFHEYMRKYECLDYVKDYLRKQENLEQLKNKIICYKSQIKSLDGMIEKKKKEVLEADGQCIIELAKRMVHNGKYKITYIQELNARNEELVKEIDVIYKKQDGQKNIFTKVFGITKNDLPRKEFQPFSSKNTDGNVENIETIHRFLLPISLIPELDLNITTERLEQTKKKMTFASIPSKNRKRTEVDIPFNFKTPFSTNIDQSQNYSMCKIINVLDDIKIQQNEAKQIISKVDLGRLRKVNEIGSSLDEYGSTVKKIKLSQENKIVEIVDVYSADNNILLPPTQFMNPSQKPKKAVSFNMSQDDINQDIPKVEELEKVTDVSMNSPMDTSLTQDLLNIKNKILKERQLDSSPEIIFTKNNAFKTDDKIIKSKFFENICLDSNANNEGKVVEIDLKDTEETLNGTEEQIKEIPVQNTVNEFQVSELDKNKEIKGPMNYGIQNNIGSLNVTTNSSVAEDADMDYPRITDPNLLLSPKYDLPNNDVGPQQKDVSNFFTGLRKPTASFFNATSSGQKTESTQNDGNAFSFVFGRGEQKKKSGLFNFFN